MRRTLLVPLLFVSVIGCGNGDSAQPTVFAASSLTAAFEALGGAEMSAGGSQTLVRQVLDGAPADVIVTADEVSMQALVDADRVERPRVFAHNRLAIVVAAGNPKGVRSLNDLARPDLTLVLADPSVPAGRYAEQVLQRAGVTVTPRSLELEVRAVLTRVVGGEADAGIVYTSDVRAGGTDIEAVDIPAAQNVVADYPVAVVKGGDASAAHEFINRLVGAEGRRVLRNHGFLLPE